MNSNPLELYLVRHGDPIKKDAQGNEIPDEERPLSEKGIAEISALSKHLLELHVSPDIIVCSFFARTNETAKIIARQLDNHSIVRSELVSESDLGTTPHTAEGLRDVQYGYDTEKIIQAGGETIEQIEERISTFIEFLRSSEFSSVIVVSHGLPLSIMSQILQGLDRTFENIQALQTGDYSYFKVEAGKTIATDVRTNVLKGKLNTA